MDVTVFYHNFMLRKHQVYFPNRHFNLRNVTNYQYANKMSSLPPLSDVKLCPFDPSFKTNSQYICYKYEKCCRQGCCSNYGPSNYQSWYFWIIIGIVLLFFYLASWYCKRKEIKSKRRYQLEPVTNRSSSTSSNSSPPITPRRSNENNMDHLLDYLIHSYRLQNVNETLAVPPRHGGNPEPPPKYQEALSMPKLVRSDVQIVQIHTNNAHSTSQSPNVEKNECPPTYDDAVKKSREEDDEND